MDSEKFEREILKLAFETDVKITVATVAYYFGIPSRDAREKLDELIDAGLLELDSDRDGNLFYTLHQDAGSAQAGRIERLLAASHAEKKDKEQSVREETPSERPSIHETLEYTQPEGAPNNQRERSEAAAQPQAIRDHSERPAKNLRLINTSETADTDANITDSSPWGEAQMRRRPSIRFRSHRPDATANRCGTSAFVVSENASCDGRPAHFDEPYTSSCDQPIPSFSQPQSAAATPSSYHSQPNHHNNTVLSPQEAYFREQQQEAMLPAVCDPDGNQLIDTNRVHHPAIAVILSICLPGAGQFYNGQIEKGVFMMLMTFLSWMAFFGWAFQLWSIFDALIVASRIRSAQEHEKQQLEHNPREHRHAGAIMAVNNVQKRNHL